MNTLKSVVIALLLGIAIFSSYKYFSSFQEKAQLLEEMSIIREQVNVIEEQRARALKDLENEYAKQKALSEEKAALEGKLQAAENDILKLRTDLRTASDNLAELNSRLAVAMAENAEVSRELGQTKADAAASRQERDMLAARFNSIPELKKAIRDLKRKLSAARREIDTRIHEDRLIIGNGGYMIRDGKPTYPTRVKIEVVPLPTQTQ